MAETPGSSPLDEPEIDHLLVEGLEEYAIFVVDPDGRIIRWNYGARALFGYAADEIIGRHFDLLFTPEDVESHEPQTELAQHSEGPIQVRDRWHVRKDGSRFWGMNTAQPLYDARAVLLGFTKIVRDLTERHKEDEELRESARRLRRLVDETLLASLHDELTGLANRHLFRELLVHAVARSEGRAHRSFALLFLDLDGFKASNESLGHLLADQLLALVARRIEGAIRAEDVLARFGGDEFAVLLEDVAGTPEAVLAARRILNCFVEPFIVEGNHVSTSVSIGIAVVSDRDAGASTPEEILKDADLAMYQVKSGGGAGYAVYYPEMRSRATAILQLEIDLRAALQRGQLRVLYEPIVDLRTKKISSFEALVHWQHPERGLLYPSEFRAKAEETGLIIPIDRWVLAEAARQLVAWRREFDDAGRLTVCLNFSATEFERDGLAQELSRILVQTALPPGSIAIEISESLPTGRSEALVSLLDEIRAAGLEIHLDDFGTGRWSVAYLSRLPITTLKIAPSFVVGLGKSDKDAAVFRAMIALARNLGLRCIAKDVATEDQLELLREFGCEEAQGPIFSGPVTAHHAHELLARGSL